MSIKIDDVSKTVLRFYKGTRVECYCGENQWKTGTIEKLFYVQRSFPEGTCAPYQVRLDEGKLIFAPSDNNRVIRLPVAPVSNPDLALADPVFKVWDKVIYKHPCLPDEEGVIVKTWAGSDEEKTSKRYGLSKFLIELYSSSQRIWVYDTSLTHVVG